MKTLICSSLGLVVAVGLPMVALAGPGSGQPNFGTRARAVLERNMDQRQPYALTGTSHEESGWRVERRAVLSQSKRPSSVVYRRGHDER